MAFNGGVCFGRGLTFLALMTLAIKTNVLNSAVQRIWSVQEDYGTNMPTSARARQMQQKMRLIVLNDINIVINKLCSLSS